MRLDSDTLDALGFGSQLEALAQSGWAERMAAAQREAQQRRYDSSAVSRAKNLAAVRKYAASAKGQVTRKRYEASEKRKAARRATNRRYEERHPEIRAEQHRRARERYLAKHPGRNRKGQQQ